MKTLHSSAVCVSVCVFVGSSGWKLICNTCMRAHKLTVKQTLARVGNYQSQQHTSQVYSKSLITAVLHRGDSPAAACATSQVKQRLHFKSIKDVIKLPIKFFFISILTLQMRTVSSHE